MESQATLKVREARTGLLLTQPFFGVLSLKLTLVETLSVATFAVNFRELKFNPEFVMSLSSAELKGVVAHEVWHLALQHHTRQGTRESELWNQAADYIVNSELLKIGFSLPQGALIDARFDGHTVESAYRMLESERQQQQQKQQEQAQKEQPDQQQPSGDDSQGQPQPDAGGQEPEPQNADGPGQPDPNGQPQPGQGQPDPVPGSGNPCGTVESAGPPDSAENGEAEREWQQHVAEAVRAASGAGNLPAGIKMAAQAAQARPAPWETLLKRFAHDQVKTRFTWSKRNKRFQDIYLPGKAADGLGEIVIGVDSSGSTVPFLNRFAGIMQELVEEIEPARVHVVYCDSKVHKVATFEHGETLTIDMVGGGGTDFRPVFERIDSEGWNPVCVIYVTDLDGTFPEEQPYPVLWAAYETQADAPMGETIHVE